MESVSWPLNLSSSQSILQTLRGFFSFLVKNPSIMASTSHRVGRDFPRSNPPRPSKSDLELNTSSDDEVEKSNSEEEDGEQELSAAETEESSSDDDPVLRKKTPGSIPFERVAYPLVEKTWIAPDQTKWSNIPDPSAKAISKFYQPEGGTCGLKTEVPEVRNAETVLDFFNLLCDDKMISIIVQWTNAKAQTSIAKRNSEQPKEIPEVWKATDSDEIRAFIGLLLLAGSEKCKKLRTRRMWRSNPKYQKPAYTATMGRERFRELLQYLRFDDIETRIDRKKTDRLAPIREFSDCLIENMHKIYEPSEYVVVDEMLVKFRGKCAFRVYMKSKPGKYGLKIWAMVDSTSRMVLNYQIYLGKEGTHPELQQGKRVLMDMMRNHLEKGRVVTADNFFGSKQAATELFSRKTALVCTMRGQRREIPKSILNTKDQDLHSSNFYFSGNMMLVAYKSKPNKIVLVLSTQHYDPLVCTIPPHKPEIILHYNATKGGVDTVDQMVAEYSCQRPSRRWPVKIFFQLLDIMAYNAFKMFMAVHPNWKPNNNSRRQDFLEELAEALIDPQIQLRPMIGLQKHVKEAMYTMGRPRPPVTPAVEGRTRNNCHICNSRTRVKCSECNNYICQRHRTTIEKHICSDCSEDV